MEESDYQRRIAEEKRGFIESGAAGAGVPDEIAKSWRRSKDYGVTPSLGAIPGRLNREVLTNLIVQLNARDSYFYESESRLLEKVGAAIVFTDDHFDVFAVRGSRELKDELRAINFRFGTNLAESRIGTNAIAIAFLTGGESWVCGNEHYLEAMTGYVCVAACPRAGDGMHSGPTFPSMIIIPADKFGEELRPLFSYILNTHVYRQNSIMNSNYLIYNAVINVLIGKNKLYYLAADNNDRIIDISDNLLGAFELKLNRTVGNDLGTVFPCLASALAGEEKDAITPVSGCLSAISPTRGRYYVRCHYVKSEGETIGRILLIAADPSELTALPAHNSVFSEAKTRERRLSGANGANYAAKYSFDDLIGDSHAFNSAVYRAKMVAKSASSVLIMGESGTGKELFAQAIHNAGDRRDKPFVSLNCAAMPRELIDSELFGYVEGAFTGARKNGAPGKIELANGGTLFLDEIGDMPLDLQVHLLKVLEDRAFTRLGDSKCRKVDIRVIAATNQDLEKLVGSGGFRLDLYYRLNVFSLELPPLRSRADDIRALSETFLRQCAGALKKPVTEISPEVMGAFTAYRWPGNLRELKNAVEYAVNLTSTERITLRDIPRGIAGAAGVSGESEGAKTRALSEITSGARLREERLISELMEKHKGNKSLVAAELGISRPALYRRLKNIKTPEGTGQPGDIKMRRS